MRQYPERLVTNNVPTFVTLPHPQHLRRLPLDTVGRRRRAPSRYLWVIHPLSSFSASEEQQCGWNRARMDWIGSYGLCMGGIPI